MSDNTRDVTETRALFLKLDGDIRSRQGIGDEWQAIDGVVMGEIMLEWERTIAAALAERESATVERCCADVCEWCKAGENKSKLYKDSHLGWMHLCEDDGKARRCKAHTIRADAARRETP